METSAPVENSPHDRCGCGEAAGHAVAAPAGEQSLVLTAALCSSEGGRWILLLWMQDVRWGGSRSAMRESLAHTAGGPALVEGVAGGSSAPWRLQCRGLWTPTLLLLFMPAWPAERLWGGEHVKA